MTSAQDVRPAAGDDLRLNGWKEIAAQLGKGVRTVQRWEKLYGLPVHRIGREGGEVVFAYRDEVEEWSRSGLRDAEGGPGDEAAAEQPAPEPAPARAHRSALALALLLVAIVAVAAWRAREAAAPPREPASWRIAGPMLRVYDAEARLLFEHDLGYAFPGPLSPGDFPSQRVAPVRFADVDGDRHAEVLVLGPAGARANGRFFVFRADGGTVLSFQPEGSVRFGEREYGGPWLAHHAFLTGGASGAPTLWVAFAHSLWFPTRLVELGLDGRVRSEYWSNGYVEWVSEATWRGRRMLLVGGVDNERRGGSLAIFDRERVGGVAPAEDPAYARRSCAGPAPEAFLVFPSLCLPARRGVMAAVVEALVEGEDRLLVTLEQGHETPSPGSPAGPVMAFYTLGPDLAPVHAEISREFQAVHRRLERQRALDHTFGPRDDEAMFPVLRFEGGRFRELPRTAVVH